MIAGPVATPESTARLVFDRRDLTSHIPRQQIGKLIDRVIGDVCQDMAQIRLRINTIELGADDERVHRGRTFAAVVGTQEQEILAPKTACP